MRRKPVNYLLVTICLLLALSVIATLILPIFQVRIIEGGVQGEYVSANGLQVIQALFSKPVDFAAESQVMKNLYVLFGKGEYGLLQYVHPVYMFIAGYSYVAIEAIATISIILCICNYIGYRFSVTNVLCGLIIMLAGILLIVCLVLHSNDAINNVVVTYSIKQYFGGIYLPIAGFLYMMFAPKKRA